MDSTNVSRRLSGAAVGLLVLLAAPRAADLPVSGITLTVPGRTNATPSIAAAGQTVAVAWGATVSAGPTDVYVVVSHDGGKAFGPAIRVNDVPGDASLGGEQPPHVALVDRTNQPPKIVVVWTAKAKGGTRLLAATSDNDGASFSKATPITGGDAAGNRGWESIAVDPRGDVLAVWLDHRETVASASSTPMNHDGAEHAGMNHGGAAAKGDSVARAQLSKLYFGRVGAATPATPVVGGVCYCCKTSLVVGSDGAIYAAWRHVYAGNVRDIAFTVSRDGGRTFATPSRVSDDHWVLDGCPENGPSLAVDSRGTVHAVWPTLVDGATRDAEPTLALFYASSPDGRSFSPRARIPVVGVPRHPQIATSADDSVTIVWDEAVDSGRRVVAGFMSRGTRTVTRRVLQDGEQGVYPAIARVADASVIAWTSGVAEYTVIRVQRIDDASSATVKQGPAR